MLATKYVTCSSCKMGLEVWQNYSSKMPENTHKNKWAKSDTLCSMTLLLIDMNNNNDMKNMQP